MRYVATYSEALGQTSVQLNANSYSDTYPLLKRILIRKVPVDLTSPALALACALLTRNYCGDLFEFQGIRVGDDFAEAIRVILNGANVANVNGLDRALSLGEQDIAVSRAGRARAIPPRGDGVPLTNVEWSGDFVDRTSRSSDAFVYGGVQTNAAYFSDDTHVSVAVGLLFGRQTSRTLWVEAPLTKSPGQQLTREALRIVGIELKYI